MTEMTEDCKHCTHCIAGRTCPACIAREIRAAKPRETPQTTEYMWNDTILPHDQPHLLAWHDLTPDEHASVERFRRRVERNATPPTETRDD